MRKNGYRYRYIWRTRNMPIERQSALSEEWDVGNLLDAVTTAGRAQLSSRARRICHYAG